MMIDIELEINDKSHWLYEIDESDDLIDTIQTEISCNELSNCIESLKSLFNRYGIKEEKNMDIIAQEPSDSTVYVYLYE